MPGMAGRPHRITEGPSAGGREDAVIKLGELVMILDLHRQGLSVSAIARQVGVDRKTVRNYLAKGLEPSTYKKRASGAASWIASNRICGSAWRPIPP